MESKTSYYDDDTYHMNPTTGGGNYDEAELWKQSQNQDLNQNTGDDVLAAATIDRTFVPTLFNDENQDYSVSNPQMQGSHISYFVKGVDKQGPWEGQRRYSHFHVLHETLMLRWPGVYIPKVPPKKAIGGKEIKFIHERRFYLERFLRKSKSVNMIKYFIFLQKQYIYTFMQEVFLYSSQLINTHFKKRYNLIFSHSSYFQISQIINFAFQYF